MTLSMTPSETDMLLLQAPRIVSSKGTVPWLLLLCLPVSLLLLLAMPLPVQGAEQPEEGPAVDSRGLSYVSLGPSFVTNYDGGGRLKYLKTDVTVRARPPATAALERHLPFIRNRLVVLFSAQLEENLTSTQGKDDLRREALEEVRGVLRMLESDNAANAVVNLFFTGFVIQS